VTFTEFKITPQVITAARACETRRHQQRHPGTTCKCPAQRCKDLPAGASETLDLGDLKAGSTYKVICEIPGHESSGMVAQLTIAEGAGGGTQTAAAGSSAGMNNPTPAEAKAMNERMVAGKQASKPSPPTSSTKAPATRHFWPPPSKLTAFEGSTSSESSTGRFSARS
jgi:hypothetical protein